MKTLLIGYGSIGKKHYNILSNFTNIESVDIVTKQNISSLFHIFKNIKDIQNLEKYDYFIVANETYKHFETLQYLDKHVKNKLILIEKPLFKNYSNYISPNNVFIAYNLRFHPIIQFLKQHQLIHINAFVGQNLTQWRKTDYTMNYSSNKEQGGGVLRDLSHEIDYIQYLCGEIVTVSGVMDKISDLKINSEDITVAVGKTKSTIINFSLDYISEVPFRKIITHTKTNTYICDFIQNTINGESLQKIDSEYTYKQMHQDILNSSFDTICTFNEGLQTMKIIEKIEQMNG